MARLTGLTPLTTAPPVYVNDSPDATPEQRYGGPADPRHAVPGEQSRPYLWE